MKKNKLLAIAALIFIGNLLIKGLFFTSVPNSPSPDEILFLDKLHLYLYPGNMLFRFSSVVISSMIAVLVYLAVYKTTKNLALSVSIALPMSISPWILVFSKFFNLYILLLFAVSFYLFIRKEKIGILFFIVIFFLFSVLNGAFSNLTQIRPEGFLNELLGIFDFKTLFFSGDYLSPYLRIPRTGFFMAADIIAFFMGLIFMLTDAQFVRFKSKFAVLGAFSLMFFFLNQRLLPSYKGVLLLFLLSIIIGYGYYEIIALSKKHRFIFIIIAALFAYNLLSYQELFYNHFDKKNSTEWGYAKMQVVEYLFAHGGQTIYLSKNSQDLERYINYYSHRKPLKYRVLTPEELIQTCKLGAGNCLLREDELSLLGIQKEQVHTSFRHYNGLPQYFLL